ncbi:MAG TPA: PilZ domain-containing protein [Methylomirabilota bacterium]|nr:PilZ domain-containing protein [Methylomirabilota bacterium]
MEDHLTRRKPQRGKKPKVVHHDGDNHDEAQTLDRRVHPRVPVSWPVRLWVEGSSIAGRTVDVSEQGLCVVLSAPPAHIDIGHSYRLDIIMGPKHEVSVNVEVRYLADAVVGLRTKQRLKLV